MFRGAAARHSCLWLWWLCFYLAPLARAVPHSTSSHLLPLFRPALFCRLSTWRSKLPRHSLHPLVSLARIRVRVEGHSCFWVLRLRECRGRTCSSRASTSCSPGAASRAGCMHLHHRDISSDCDALSDPPDTVTWRAAVHYTMELARSRWCCPLLWKFHTIPSHVVIVRLWGCHLVMIIDGNPVCSNHTNKVEINWTISLHDC